MKRQSTLRARRSERTRAESEPRQRANARGRGIPGRSERAKERGTITLWVLGLCLMVFLLGGISLDLWRAFSERRALASIVDAAAVAGASAVDEGVYRAANVVQLDPALAQQRAQRSLAGQLDRRALRGAHVSADLDQVTVVVQGSVDFSLLDLVTPGGTFAIEVRARAVPQPTS